MEAKNLQPHSKAPATWPYPEPEEMKIYTILISHNIQVFILNKSKYQTRSLISLKLESSSSVYCSLTIKNTGERQ
jgi:predicted lactoylglutathione lyase